MSSANKNRRSHRFARFRHQHQQTFDHIEMEVAVVAKKLQPKHKLTRSKQAVEQSSESEAGSGGSRGSSHYTTPAGNVGQTGNKVKSECCLNLLLRIMGEAGAVGRGVWPREWRGTRALLICSHKIACRLPHQLLDLPYYCFLLHSPPPQERDCDPRVRRDEGHKEGFHLSSGSPAGEDGLLQGHHPWTAAR